MSGTDNLDVGLSEVAPFKATALDVAAHYSGGNGVSRRRKLAEPSRTLRTRSPGPWRHEAREQRR